MPKAGLPCRRDQPRSRSSRFNTFYLPSPPLPGRALAPFFFVGIFFLDPSVIRRCHRRRRYAASRPWVLLSVFGPIKLPRHLAPAHQPVNALDMATYPFRLSVKSLPGLPAPMSIALIRWPASAVIDSTTPLSRAVTLPPPMYRIRPKSNVSEAVKRC